MSEKDPKRHSEVNPEFRKISIQRALISVANKTGLIDFAKGLASLGIKMETTSGTWHFLRQNGLEGWQVEPILSYELLGGKIKTLNPKVFAAILADRKSRREMKELKELWWEKHTYDLVVVNLYTDKLDVGGYALLRAAAKNYRFVVSLCNPADYPALLQEMRENNQTVSQQSSYNMAVKTLRYLEESAHQAISLLEEI